MESNFPMLHLDKCMCMPALLLKKYLRCEARARWGLIQHMPNYNLSCFSAFHEQYIIPSLCNTFGFYDPGGEGDDVNLICAH